ncbi:MAG: PAC2 family protein [Candidatus Heimdallarchaeota archaeon]
MEWKDNGTLIKEIDAIPLKDGVLVQGLPGMGFVGHLAVNFLIDELKAKEVARIYSSYFPPIVRLAEDGIGRLTRAELYAVLTEPNLLLFTGDTQPIDLGIIQTMNTILDYAEKLGCTTVIALGGLRSPEGPEVAAFAYTEETKAYLQQKELEILTGGEVTGAVGVLTAVAAERGLTAYGLLGKISLTGPDPVAAKNVLKVIQNTLGFQLHLDIAKLDEKIEKALEREEMTKKIFNLMKKKQQEEPSERWYI